MLGFFEKEKHTIFYFPEDYSRCGINSAYFLAIGNDNLAYILTIEDESILRDIENNCFTKEFNTVPKEFQNIFNNFNFTLSRTSIFEMPISIIFREKLGKEIEKENFNFKSLEFEPMEPVYMGLGNFGNCLGKYVINTQVLKKKF